MGVWLHTVVAHGDHLLVKPRVAQIGSNWKCCGFVGKAIMAWLEVPQSMQN